VTNRSDVDVRFVPYKLFLRHWVIPPQPRLFEALHLYGFRALSSKKDKGLKVYQFVLVPNNKKRHPAGL
jgi:hypothetical protein